MNKSENHSILLTFSQPQNAPVSPSKTLTNGNDRFPLPFHNTSTIEFPTLSLPEKDTAFLWGLPI